MNFDSAAIEIRGGRVPHVVPGCDLRKLPITPLEAYVFSRIDGNTSEDDLVACTGLQTELVGEALDRLASLGALRFATSQPKRSVSAMRPRAAVPATTTAPPAPVSGPQPRRRTSRAPAAMPSHSPRSHATVAPARTSITPVSQSGPARKLTPVPSTHRPSTMRPGHRDQLRRYLDGARVAIDEGNALAAANYYRLAQQIAPDDGAIQGALSECAAASAEMRASTERAAKLVLVGDNAARAREWEVAGAAYQDAAQLAPRDASVLYKAAGCLYRLGRIADAAEYAERSVKIVSTRFETWFLLAQVYAEAGAITSAQMAAARAKKLKPEDGRVVKLIAKIGADR